MTRFITLWMLGVSLAVLLTTLSTPTWLFMLNVVIAVALIVAHAGGWRILAWLLTRDGALAWLQAFSFPYSNITGPDGSTYMVRLWVFNPYGKDASGEVTPPRWTWLPSVRLHRIMRPDMDRALHNHPWPARTIVLRGWYIEERLCDPEVAPPGAYPCRAYDDQWRYSVARHVGYTGTLNPDTFHRITEVSPGGVWTLFFTWRKAASWGFLVDGKVVPWREYLK